MRRFSVPLALSLVLTALALPIAPAASAAETLTASCEPPAIGSTSSSGSSYIAMPFRSQLSGPLTRAELEVDKSGTAGDYMVEIRTADPSGRPGGVIGSSVVADGDVPAGVSRISAVFASPPTVLAGQPYAVSITRPASDTLQFRAGAGSDACEFYRWFSSDGTSWSAPGGGGPDQIFRAFVDLPPGAASATCKGQQATIVGTEGNDVRVGTSGKDVIAGLGGNDKLSGLAGNDTICGGTGRDTLSGGKGNDKLFGEAGKDTLKGGAGKDKLKGGAGKDKQVQ